MLALIRQTVGSTEEQQTVLRLYRELVRVYLSSPHRRRVERLEAAFRLALRAHAGMRRHNGDPYILHPLAVARIVAAELKLGSTSICAALLHDATEHAAMTESEIAEVAGPKVAAIVSAITRISGGTLTGHDVASSGDFRSLLLSMQSDVRVIIVKMAERLHNMQTIGSERRERQLGVARETLFVYAPLAERLGLFSLKQQLEELAFACLYPDEHALISQALARSQAERSQMVAEFLAPVRQGLDKAGFRYEIKARVKSAYSIYNKMRKKGIPLDQIYDIFAVRIIFDNPTPEGEDPVASDKRRCWEVYSILTDHYTPHPERIRDWTSVPKSNGYSALHATCMGPSGDWVEVQIRSRRMDELAELGCAAHWHYKTHDKTVPELDQWLSTIRDVLAAPCSDGMDTLDNIRLGLCAHEIFVFTHRGELMRLPAGATVAEMSRRAEPASRCLGAKVNHRLVSPAHTLSSGDRVELVTVPLPAEDRQSQS